jgi:hypothetical protein
MVVITWCVLLDSHEFSGRREIESGSGGWGGVGTQTGVADGDICTDLKTVGGQSYVNN